MIQIFANLRICFVLYAYGWEYASGTYAYSQHAHKKLNDLSPQKIKIINLYFSPKVTDPERLYGVKIMNIQRWKILHWDTCSPNVNDHTDIGALSIRIRLMFTELKLLDLLSLGSCVSWTMRPLDNVRREQCIPVRSIL